MISFNLYNNYEIRIILIFILFEEETETQRHYMNFFGIIWIVNWDLNLDLLSVGPSLSVNHTTSLLNVMYILLQFLSQNT